MLQGDDVACERRAPESQLRWSFIGMRETIRGDYDGCALGVSSHRCCDEIMVLIGDKKVRPKGAKCLKRGLS